VELTANSISISPLHYADKERLAKLANNKKIWMNVRDMFPHPYTVSDAERFIESTTQQDPQSTFAIRYNLKLSGVIGLVLQEDVYRFSAELGYWIGEPFWNKGIATHAVQLMVQYAFEELKLLKVFAGVFEGNEASKRVLEKCGFELEGIARKAVFKNNVLIDEYRYGLVFMQ
jgi:RimJ/RimL family protein N-acetyltransferase